MKNLIPFPHWRPCGSKPSGFYLCRCERCGFAKRYEVSDCDVISQDGTDTDSDSGFAQVKMLPKVCPMCGKKLKNTKISNPIKY